MNASLSLALTRRFMASVVRDDEALRFFLNNASDAESNGEGAIFERVKPFLEPKLQKLVDTHAADEVRHAKLLADELARLGGTLTVPAEELRVVERAGRVAGDLWNKPVEGPRDVARAYLLLYAIERRAIERFTLMEEALRGAGRTQTADLFASIAKDEARHLRYCVVVSRAMLPDEKEWDALRDEMVEAEAQAFTTNSQLFMNALIDGVFTTMGFWRRMFWKDVVALNAWMGATIHVMDVGVEVDLPGGRKAMALPA